ncbi:type II secretion system F family protein [Candidatus Micrarchaeota archaeon]|nr:type II secretion system F family protein [Candidatus Micrarchaeota archaeon]
MQKGGSKKKIPFFGQVATQPTKPRPLAFLSEPLLKYFPDLKSKLALANLKQTSREFIEKAVFSAIYMSLALLIVTVIVFNALSLDLILLVVFSILLSIVYFIGFFLMMMYYPVFRINQRQKDLEVELVFAGRHLLIALRAGLPFFDALVSVSSGYGVVSEEFRKVVDKLGGGIPMGQALREVSSDYPKSPFSSMLLQLSNAVSSGADIADSLESALSQISRGQVIALKAYGQKLNPLVMFFMIFGIIFPSLGVAFAVILFSFVSGGMIGMGPIVLLYVFFFIALVQFFFLTLVENSRPRFMV